MESTSNNKHRTFYVGLIFLILAAIIVLLIISMILVGRNSVSVPMVAAGRFDSGIGYVTGLIIQKLMNNRNFFSF